MIKIKLIIELTVSVVLYFCSNTKQWLDQIDEDSKFLNVLVIFVQVCYVGLSNEDAVHAAGTSIEPSKSFGKEFSGINIK